MNSVDLEEEHQFRCIDVCVVSSVESCGCLERHVVIGSELLRWFLALPSRCDTLPR